MNTQDVLDPKSWAERTFGSVQLHDMRRTRRSVKAATKLAENPLGALPVQMRTWKETKALYRLRGCARCELRSLDATAPAADHGLGECRSRGAVGARYHRYRSVASSTSISGVGQISNERGRGFFVQTVLAVRTTDPRGARMHGSGTVRAHSRSRGRTALSKAQARRARNGCLDAPGTCHWNPLRQGAGGSISAIGEQTCSRSAEACQVT